MTELDPESFGQKVISEKAVSLVTFWADWCAPCGLQEAVLKKLASDYAEKALIGRVNVDQYEELAERFCVRTLPTTLVFFQGELVESLIGFQADEYLRGYLEQLVQQAEASEESSPPS